MWMLLFAPISIAQALNDTPVLSSSLFVSRRNITDALTHTTYIWNRNSKLKGHFLVECGTNEKCVARIAKSAQCDKVKVYPFTSWRYVNEYKYIHSVPVVGDWNVRHKCHWIRVRFASFAGHFRRFVCNKHAMDRRRGVIAWHIFVLKASLWRHSHKYYTILVSP